MGHHREEAVAGDSPNECIRQAFLDALGSTWAADQEQHPGQPRYSRPPPAPRYP